MYHAAISTGKDGVLVQGGYETTTARTINGTTVVSSLVTFKPTVNNTNPHSPPYLVPRIGAPVSLARNAPAVARHTMTLTPDGRAILLGGINSQGLLANLSQAYVLDTQADAGAAEWKTVTLSGKPPDPRVAFSTVMVNVTTILVYGGTSDFKSAFWATFYLDLPTWTWSSPTAQGVIPRRWGHTATMAGNIMVVAF
ncbi:Serine/threonine-protein phosphatase bsl1, partial [Mortierella claussenii]